MYKLKDIQRYTKSQIKQIKPPSMADVEESKITNVFNTLSTILDNKGYEKYVSHIERFVEKPDENTNTDGEGYFTSLDVAAAFLKMMLEKNSATAKQEVDEFANTGASLGMVRLFLNMGRMDKLQPKNVLEGICSVTNMPGSAIGSIDVYDKFTFIEVPRDYAAEILNSVRDIRIRGRKVNMEKANSK